MRIGFCASPVQPELSISSKSFKITLDRLGKLADWLNKLGIDFYRFPSKMFPTVKKEFVVKSDSGEKVVEKRVIDFSQVQSEVIVIGQLGKFYKSRGIRTCLHTSLYCNPVSLKEDVVKRSIDEIEILSYFLNKFGSGWLETRLGPIGVSRESAFSRFETFYESLSENTKSKLVIENDSMDVMFGSTQDLLDLNDMFGVKIVFDTGNFAVNPSEHRLEYVRVVEAFFERWKDGVPVFHYNNINPSDRDEIDADLFWGFCSAFYENDNDRDFDVMLTSKGREFDVVSVKNFAVDNGIWEDD